MGICSVLITTDETNPDLPQTLDEIRRDRRLTLGVRQRGVLAAVVETDSVADDRRCLEWLDRQPGIRSVQIVLAHYESPEGDRDGRPPDPVVADDAPSEPHPDEESR